jgi:uncharacterized short protein YbdD (DUF466 family)
VAEEAGASGGLLDDIGRAGRYMAQSLRLMVGVPDYGGYVAHMRATHPDQEPMNYEAFFRERQAARYASSTGKCC